MLPAGCTLRSGLWLQMIGCVGVSLSQNVITTLVRNPSLSGIVLWLPELLFVFQDVWCAAVCLLQR